MLFVLEDINPLGARMVGAQISQSEINNSGRHVLQMRSGEVSVTTASHVASAVGAPKYHPQGVRQRCGEVREPYAPRL